MNHPNPERHGAPNPGILALVYAGLFIAGLSFVVTFQPPEHQESSATAVRPYFPGPWESPQTITTYFQTHRDQVLWCAFLQFGAAIPLGLFTAVMVSRLLHLGVKSAGAHIALFGGAMAALDIAIQALALWVMAVSGIAENGGALLALYYLVFAIGGVGFSVPMGILIVGISIPTLLSKLLPRWVPVAGLVLAVVGELSFFSLVISKALFLIPLTRFPSFLWLMAAGFLLPKVSAAARKDEFAGPSSVGPAPG